MIATNEELRAHLATGVRTRWQIEVGTMAALESTDVFEATERGAIRRFCKAKRSNPDKIVCLYWVNPETGQRGGRSYRSHNGERSRLPAVRDVDIVRVSNIGRCVRVDVSTHVFIGRLEYEKARCPSDRPSGYPVGVSMIEMYEVVKGHECFLGYATGAQHRALAAPLLQAAKRETTKRVAEGRTP